MPQMNLDTSSLTLFSLLKPLAALYLLVIAIIGKGKLLHHEYPKCTPEQYRTRMRILSAVAGVLLGISGVFEILHPDQATTFLGRAIWVLGLLGLVGILVFSAVMTDHEKARKADEEERRSGTRPTPKGSKIKMPEDAFRFSDEKENASPKDGR